MNKLNKDFYQKPALELVKDFLGKYLVFNSPKGRVSGMISDVEAYPAFTDNVSHGNKRTARTEVMYREGGLVYVYLIYGIYHQFAVVVNKQEIPEVIFIRGVIPDEGVEIMKQNFEKEVKKIKELTSRPGNLCKSFGITKELYGADLTGEIIYIEDRGIIIDPLKIKSTRRVGISKKLDGSDLPLRFYVG